jgi:hypothetical protein
MISASGNSIGTGAPPLLQPLRQRPANRVRCVCPAPRPQSRCTSDRPGLRCSSTAHPRRLTMLLSYPSVPPRSTRARSSSASRRLPRCVPRSARDSDACVSLHVRRALRVPCAPRASRTPRRRRADGRSCTGRMTKDEELRGSACAIFLSTAGFQSIGAPPSRQGLGAGRP